MKAVAKSQIKVDDLVIPKGAEGFIIAISNRHGDWKYLVNFQDIGECLVDTAKVEVK